jgi:hypothetical protein
LICGKRERRKREKGEKREGEGEVPTMITYIDSS